MARDRSFGRMTLEKLEQIAELRTHGVSTRVAAGILDIREESVRNYYSALEKIEHDEPLTWFGKRLSTAALSQYCKKHGHIVCIEKIVPQEDLLDFKDVAEGIEIDDKQDARECSFEEFLASFRSDLLELLCKIADELKELNEKWR